MPLMYLYYKLMLYFFFLMILLMLMNYVMTELMASLQNKVFLYECGFDCVYWMHNKMSLHFFKIGLIFVLFDLEIMFFMMIFFNSHMYFFLWFLFLFIVMTLFLEMKMNAFLWFY